MIPPACGKETFPSEFSPEYGPPGERPLFNERSVAISRAEIGIPYCWQSMGFRLPRGFTLLVWPEICRCFANLYRPKRKGFGRRFRFRGLLCFPRRPTIWHLSCRLSHCCAFRIFLDGASLFRGLTRSLFGHRRLIAFESRP